jgi:S-DNA-T family DNA segregation ATPase FtsK/SpoIIIE
MEQKNIEGETIQTQIDTVLETFNAFEIPMELAEVIDGLTALRIRLQPKVRVRMNALQDFADDLCFALAVKRVEITAPVLGTRLIEVAIPKEHATPFIWHEAVSTNALQIATGELVVPIGRNDFNEDLVLDLATLPQLLVAGVTGSGKSTLLHTIINSLITQRSPDQLALILIDPKRVEFYPYEGLPHLISPVITDSRPAMTAMFAATKEMKRRFALLDAQGIRDVQAYHQEISECRKREESDVTDTMPYLVMIVDEFTNLMAAYGRDLEALLLPIAQMGRTVGIHLILSTARPAANVYTKSLKETIPARIAFRVASVKDSQTMLDHAGAEKLAGGGDMLFRANAETPPVRFQACYLSEADIEENVTSVKTQYQEAHTKGSAPHRTMHLTAFASEDDDSDELYEQVELIVRKVGKASTSLIQRRLGIGYGRAARLIDMLESRGVIGPADGAKPREVIHKEAAAS